MARRLRRGGGRHADRRAHGCWRVDILHDVGRSLNPAHRPRADRGRLRAGQGWLTTEVVEWDAKGRLLDHVPGDLQGADGRATVPQAAARIASVGRRERGADDRTAPKAVGEPPLMLADLGVPRAAATRGDRAATRGLPKLDAPATPERFLRAIAGLRAHDLGGRTISARLVRGAGGDGRACLGAKARRRAGRDADAGRRWPER
jgi:xanthine dehydrogenase large subunit